MIIVEDERASIRDQGRMFRFLSKDEVSCFRSHFLSLFFSLDAVRLDQIDNC